MNISSVYPPISLKTLDIPAITAQHPWVLSRQLQKPDTDIPHGALVTIVGPNQEHLGVGTYSAHSTIAARFLSRQVEVITQDWFIEKIRNADTVRTMLGYGANTDTTGYRVVFGEADFLSGLVIDRFNDVLVYQLSTAGMDSLRELIVGALKALFSPRAIVERSDMGVRKEEQLEEVIKVQHGELSEPVPFTQHGLSFLADPLNGQKTGFFLDQGTLRQIVTSLANSRRTLNLFSYTGGFTVAALKGGATEVVNVDSSKPALELIPQNLQLNTISLAKSEQIASEAFDWLSKRNEPEFDMVILDPPALMKSKRDIESGRKGYHFLNRASLRLVKDNGIFVTSSCSAFFSEDDFLITLRRAAMQAGVTIRILHRVYQNPDHPIVPYFLDGAYLKSFVCSVSRP